MLLLRSNYLKEKRILVCLKECRKSYHSLCLVYERCSVREHRTQCNMKDEQNGRVPHYVSSITNYNSIRVLWEWVGWPWQTSHFYRLSNHFFRVRKFSWPHQTGKQWSMRTLSLGHICLQATYWMNTYYIFGCGSSFSLHDSCNWHKRMANISL